MENITHSPSAFPALRNLESFRTIESLENQYGLGLSKIGFSFEESCPAYLELERICSKQTQLMKRLALPQSNHKFSAVSSIYKRYVTEIQNAHQKISFWLKLYLGLIWPEEITNPVLRRRRILKQKEDWQKHSRVSLEQLSIQSFFSKKRQTSLEKLLQLYNQHQSAPRTSRLFNNSHRALRNAVYDELIYTANETRAHIYRLFEKTLYQGEHPNSFAKSSVSDWLDGYKTAGPAEITAQKHADQHFFKGLQLSSRRRFYRLALRNCMIALTAFLILFWVHSLRIDTTIYQFVKTGALRLLRLDPASISLKEKKNFFYKFIVELDHTIKPKDILAQVEIFKNDRLFEKPSGAYYFAEHILGPYFLSLTREHIPPDLTARVIETAGLIDPAIQNIVGEIARMFESKSIEDSKLRGKLLELRRAFVKHRIFPFTFIIIENDTPYLFLYPEYILKRYTFPAEALQQIGFDPSYYAKFVRFPLKTYVVKGDRYPFKDRSGYFEGEFGIVFAGLAADTEWTAWHETAHIIDQMRFMYGGKPFPKNMEINAMLLPLIFSQDPKAYLQQRLFPILETLASDDSYVQAAKGIINGFLLLEPDGEKIPLLTEPLHAASVGIAKNILLAQSNETIRMEALGIYKNPSVYLKTAKPGRYKGIITNAEEVIAGTPRAPYQGFILSGYSKSKTSNTSGIKFSFDGMDSDFGFFQGKNLLGIIQEIFSFMAYARHSNARGFALINIIAAVVDFFLILGAFFVLHLWAAPFRKRKFYGPPFQKWLKRIYQNNPISDGRGFGGLPGEKTLLMEAVRSQRDLTDDLRQRIKILKSGMNPSQIILFDTLLVMAPFNPRICAVTSKWHDFIFWLPFLGPALARNSWISPRQKAFRQWEQFNDEVFKLAAQITPDSSGESIRESCLKILTKFGKRLPNALPDSQKEFTFLHETEKLTKTILHEMPLASQLKKPEAMRSLPWLGRDDGEFDHLANYQWGDNIKQIDWKATARSARGEAKVRRYSGTNHARFDFLLDFRSLHRQSKRERLARDLACSLGLMKNDNQLKGLTIILPSGEVKNRQLNIYGSRDRLAICQAVFMAVRQIFEDDWQQKRAWTGGGLAFYTDDENKFYAGRIQLTDFMHSQEYPKELGSIVAQSIHTYFIGVEQADRSEIISHLPKNHPFFYWE